MVCAEFGKIFHLRILPPMQHRVVGKFECECFLMFGSVAVEAAFHAKHRVSEFRRELRFLAEVDTNWTDPNWGPARSTFSEQTIVSPPPPAILNQAGLLSPNPSHQSEPTRARPGTEPRSNEPGAGE